MTSTFRRSFVVFFAATTALSAIPSALADQAPDCAAARKSASSLSALWKERGRCDLTDEDNASVRPDPWGAALTKFRAFKAEWLTHFDKKDPHASGYELDGIRSMAAEFISHHPDHYELNEKLQAVVTGIDALDRAVDRMRPNGATTPGAIAAIDRALGELQDTCTQARDGNNPYCPGDGQGALDQLDHILQTDPGVSADPALAPLKQKLQSVSLVEVATGLDRIRNILNCRLSNERLISARALIHSPACGTLASTAPAAQPAPAANAIAQAGDNGITAMPLKSSGWTASDAVFSGMQHANPDENQLLMCIQEPATAPLSSGSANPDQH